LQDVLFAPLALYPAGGSIVALPIRLDDKSERYLESIVERDLQHRARFLLVCEWQQRVTYELWLRGRLAPLGFRSESQGSFGDVGVFMFSRGVPAGQ
jgi:hypothetical protein